MTPARALTLILLFALILLAIGLPMAAQVYRSDPTATATATIPSIGGDATTMEWGP